MSEAEVLYSDVKFMKKKGDTTEAVSSSLDTTYSEIKILGSQPSNELPAPQQVVSNGGSKVKSQKVALMILCVLLAVVVIAFCYVLYTQTKEKLKVYEALEKNFTETVNNYMQIKEMHENLTAKYEALEKNFTETLSKMTKTCPTSPKPPEIKPNDSCPKCDKGWEEFGGKCYYFSNKTSSWNESRHYCRSRGGDLVKIDSREEQEFLKNKLSDKMRTDEVKFWIGLTDSKEEGNWFWVDNSPLDKSLTFWRKGEPDNWDGENPEGEDCVRMGEKKTPDLLEIWTDKSCNMLQRSICEKQAETGHIKVMCF